MLEDVIPASRRLLVVDPCHECERLLSYLRAGGWRVESCALEKAAERDCDVGLLRLQALSFRPQQIKELIRSSAAAWIIALTPNELNLHGIGDFVGEWFFDVHTLPFDVARLKVALGRACMARLHELGSSRNPAYEYELLGNSRRMKELRKLLTKLGPIALPVLIRGESGTGKELVARTLHAHSRRPSGPFVGLNCAAISEPLLQSKLFGHEEGAFTEGFRRTIGGIESADGGTLFLDEIDSLSLKLQANLLRFLQGMQSGGIGATQSFSVNVRLLAATDFDLEHAIRQKRFREDLYYQFNVLHVQTAPLRERRMDIPFLADHLASLYSVEVGRCLRHFSEAALEAMLKHPWPGNVRELSNRVRRALMLAEGRQIEAVDLGLGKEQNLEPAIGTLNEYIFRAERLALNDVLTRYSGNMSEAARVLGISRPTFYRLLHKHQIR
ncbi:sigma-54 dependent transcriptional regulator [Pseudomonas sp. 2FE]|uniref:sigma-54-dependent transcriptional regulator n=1 Tax=Pseudomonas sp. 2FE TaxID=2502190 RepID=UPI0010F67E29|nr:sigma-54 dependent transcriptional regulator [Pseudomonas sp. 2FE]